MKILVPLNNLEHIDDYIKAGAQEFYMGFYDEKWQEEFGEFGDLNRMSGLKEISNPYNLKEVIEIIKMLKQKGVESYVTFNAGMYSSEQLRYMGEYFNALKQADVDGVIISTMEQTMLANEIGVPAIISTIAGVYNSDIARFYAKNGAKRIILPRDVSMEEIKTIKEELPNMEYEIFMMRNGCTFSDSNCLGLHRKEKCSICSSIKRAKREIVSTKNDFKTMHEAELNDMVYTNEFHNEACGLCAIYDFIKLGITAGKIVGRSDEWQYICRDIGNIRENIDIAKECNSREEFLEKMVFPGDRVVRCKMGLSCYYPEIRF